MLMTSKKTNKIQISWNDPAFRAIVYQIAVLGIVAYVAWYLVTNTMHNLSVRNITTGFDFLDREAGFAIGESSIAYSPADTYKRAILVGIVNTLQVSALGIVLSTLLGTIIGVARLSMNWLVGRLATVYVEVIRNVPLLIQLFFWYVLITENLPGPRQALRPVEGVFLSNRGLKFPALQGDSLSWILYGLLLAALCTFVFYYRSRRHQEKTGKTFPVLSTGLLMLLVFPFIGYFLGGASLALEYPELRGFNFTGGLSISPELSALLAGLVIYTSAFVAEIVRSGIQSIGSGQWEAASSIGLGKARVLRLVILPQALRVMIPPLTSTYLNLTKNS